MAAASTMDLTHDDIAKILKIIDDAAHLDEVELEFAGLRLHVRRDASPGESVRRLAAAAAAPVAAPPPSAAVPAKKAPGAEPPPPAGAVAVRAPMLGTFYRSPSPGEKPFVEVGQHVKAGDTVCLIEVMKLFNSISAGVDGTVVAIPAQNGVLVEFNQPLVYVMADSPDGD
jgi:acetyl-CoA carboxylase biotin carboxyl carrier protein